MWAYPFWRKSFCRSERQICYRASPARHFRQKNLFALFGPVQSGNARQIPRLFQYIHSIGSWQELAIIEKTVEKLNKQQEEATGGKQVEKKLPIGYFLQLRLSKEKTKVTGFKPEQLEQASHFPTNDWVSFQGFMTMGTFNDRNQTEEIFHQAKEIRDHLAPSAKLSMGMSDDWDLAIRYDTDWLRIGSYFFWT